MLIIKRNGLEVPIPRHIEAAGSDALKAYVEDKFALAQRLSAENTPVKEEDTDVG